MTPSLRSTGWRRVVWTGAALALLVTVVPGNATTSLVRGLPVINGHVLVSVDGATISVPIPRSLAGQPITKATATLRNTQRAAGTPAYGPAARPMPAGRNRIDARYSSVRDRSSSLEPGTITTVAGGYCDGLGATEATIAPRNLLVGHSGRPYWVDDDASSVPQGFAPPISWGGGAITDQGNFTPFLGMHTRGSFLIRTVTHAGHVKTLGPVLPPEQGEIMRMNFLTQYRTRVVQGPDGSLYTAILHNPFAGITAHPVGDTRIVRLTPRGRQMVVGGMPYQVTTAVRDPIGYGDNDPVTRTAVGDVGSFAFDTAGGMFIAEDGPVGARIRYANLTSRPVTFYGGTSDALTIDPGRIRSIAGFSSKRDPSGTPDDMATRMLPTRVFDSQFGLVPSLRWRDDILYVADQHDFGPNLQIRAINLGVHRPEPRVVLGTPVAPGYVALLAGADKPTPATGDGGPALFASFGVNNRAESADFDLDPRGDLIIADPLNNEVRIVEPSGPGDTARIRALAGGAIPGFAGDGGPAARARLNGPASVAVARNGDIFISDYWNGRIRRIHHGVISTAVGVGPYSCGAGQPATSSHSYYRGSHLGLVRDIAPDQAGGFFVADGAYNSVTHFDAHGIVDAVIGRPMGCMENDDLQTPQCPLLGNQSTDPGRFADATLAEPFFLTSDSYNNVYISDYDRVRYANLTHRTLSVNGKRVPPRSIVTIAVFPNRTVHVSLTGVSGRPPYVGNNPLPLGDLAVDDAGNLYIADLSFNRIYRIDRCGNLTLFAGTGQSPAGDAGGGYPANGGDRADTGGALHWGDGLPVGKTNVSPGALAFDRARNALLVVDGGWPGVTRNPGGVRIRAINLTRQPLTLLGRRILPLHIDSIAGLTTGGAFGDGGLAADASISGATTIAVGPDGRIYLAESMDARIQEILPDGRIGTIAGPWPERTPDTPMGADYWHWGTSGDGQDALHAWVNAWGKITGLNNYPAYMGFVALDARGRLLLADHTSGRVRAISDVADAPIRLSAPGDVPLTWSGPVGLRTAKPLPDEPDTVSGPALDPTGRFVVASRGTQLGCDLWKRRPSLQRVGTPFGSTGPAGASGALPASIGIGGSDCTIGWATFGGVRSLYLATLVDAGEAGTVGGRNSVAVVIATTSNPAADRPIWRTTVVPMPDLPVSMHRPFLVLGGQVGPTAGLAGGVTLAYLDSSQVMHVSTSPDGIHFLPIGRAAWPRTTGLSSGVLLHGHVFLAASVTAGDSRVASGPAVAETVTGQEWTFHSLGSDGAGPSPANPPALASNGKQLFALDTHPPRVRLTRHQVGGGWTTQSVPGAPTGYLSTLTMGPGRSLVAAESVPDRAITSYDDAQTTWYGATFVLEPHSDRYVARSVLGVSRQPVSQGALCVNVACEIARCTSLMCLALYDSDVWRPSIAVDHRGFLVATFNEQVGPRYFRPLRALLARSCRPVLAKARSCDQHGSAVISRIPGGATGGLPNTPSPVAPALLATCSPLPPATTNTEPVPGAAGEHSGQSSVPGHREAPAPVAPPGAPVEQPVEPAVPPGAAPAAQAQQAPEPVNQPAQQPQPGVQPGMAAADEPEAARARNFAFSRRHTSPYPPVGWAWLTVLGAGLVVVTARRRAHPARASVATKSGDWWQGGRRGR